MKPLALAVWFTAVRPGFLLVTVACALLGASVAMACGCAWHAGMATATLVLAVLAHAAANLANDWGDARLGSDAINVDRLPPFSGGSQLIQRGLLTPEQVHQAALRLTIVVVGGGLILAARSGPGLLLIGTVGLVLAWGYSTPRVALMARGVGEAGVVLAWWLIVVGADYVQRGRFDAVPMLAGISPALLVGSILLAASFPDARADAQVGKRTLRVRLGARKAARLYAVVTFAAHGVLALGWALDLLPQTAWWALLSLPLGVAAALVLDRRATETTGLRPVLVLTVGTALVHIVALTAAFVAIARLR